MYLENGREAARPNGTAPAPLLCQQMAGFKLSIVLDEEKGGFRYVEEEEEDYDDEFYQDKTDTAKEPTGDRTVELATAQHCEGAKGNMILVAQRLTGVALA